MPIIIIDEDNVYYLKYIKKVINKYFICIKKTPEKYTYHIRLGKFYFKINNFFSQFPLANRRLNFKIFYSIFKGIFLIPRPTNNRQKPGKK